MALASACYRLSTCWHRLRVDRESATDRQILRPRSLWSVWEAAPAASLSPHPLRSEVGRGADLTLLLSPRGQCAFRLCTQFLHL